MADHIFEHPDRSKLIDRSSSHRSDPQRSPPAQQKHQANPNRPNNRSRSRHRRERHPPNEDKGDRSRSPLRRSHARDGRDRESSPSPKRRRRRSPSPLPNRRRHSHEDGRKPIRRRTSSSRSPFHQRVDDRKPSRRGRDESNSPRRRYPRSPDHYKHSKRRSSRRRSSHGYRDRSHDRSHRAKHRDKHSASPAPPSSKRLKAPLPSQQDAFSGDTTVIRPDEPPPIEKQKPSLAPTGALAKETNTAVGTSIILKYNEPPESRLPPASATWRMYVFKGEQELEKLDLYTRSCWLFGRERAVVDMPTEHPSCSKQHAVIQFRYTEKRGEFGDRKGGVKPYIIDLDSANGTMVNGEKIDGRRYMELRTGDVLKFGESTREYVLLLPPKM